MLRHQYFIAMGACNLKCQHCWYETGDLDYAATRVKPITLENWLRQSTAAFPVQSFTITGGEPMLRKDFGALLDVVSSFHLDIGVLTNGTLVTPEWADRFRSDNIEVFISLDSLTPEYHNSIRERHADVLRGLQYLIDGNVRRRHITTVVSKGNIDQIVPLQRFASENGFRIHFHPAALAADHPHNLTRCSDEELTTLLRNLRSWAEEEDRVYYLGLISAVARNGAPPKLHTCRFTAESLIIDSDGTFYPCFQHREETLGNIVYSTPDEVTASKASFMERFKPASCIKTDCLGVF